jgi:hypothetical protein
MPPAAPAVKCSLRLAAAQQVHRRGATRYPSTSFEPRAHRALAGRTRDWHRTLNRASKGCPRRRLLLRALRGRALLLGECWGSVSRFNLIFDLFHVCPSWTRLSSRSRTWPPLQCRLAARAREVRAGHTSSEVYRANTLITRNQQTGRSAQETLDLAWQALEQRRRFLSGPGATHAEVCSLGYCWHFSSAFSLFLSESSSTGHGWIYLPRFWCKRQ